MERPPAAPRGLVRVVNATGVVLHTNLGRAPLSVAARAAALDAAGYTDLELDLATGERGSRAARPAAHLVAMTGAEDATVVNNGAAALLLALAATAAGRDVVAARAELDAASAYRVRDLIGVAGARLVEVGDGAGAGLPDLMRAIGPATGAVLTVGARTPDAALIALAHERSVPVLQDLGSGLLVAETAGPLAGEPSVADAIALGVDLVTCAGDKLLGGPQAGLIVGRERLLAACRRHALARALRLGKLDCAALEATLAAHRAGEAANLPVTAMLTADADELERRAHRMADELGPPAEARAVEGVAGGGVLADARLTSWAVALVVDDVEGLAARLRTGEVPVVARAVDGALVLDLRTVPADGDAELADLVLAALDVAPRTIAADARGATPVVAIGAAHDGAPDAERA